MNRWVRHVGAAMALVGVLSTLGAARAGASAFRRIGTTNGLNARVVPAVLVDRQGFLWVGSREGLFRYDGYGAVAFLPRHDDERSISDIDIRALYQDPHGTLWIATNTSGVNRFDPNDGTFARFRHDPADPKTLSHDSVYGMSTGPEGDLWVGTQIGLNRFDRDSGTFTRYSHDPDDPGSLSNNYVFTLHLDRSNSLWVATVGGGLSRWQPESGSFRRYDLASMAGAPAAVNDVFAIWEDADGALWAGTRSGLVLVSPDREEVEWVRVSPTGSPEPLITSMAPAGGSRVWLGTMNHGLIVYDAASREGLQLSDADIPPEAGIMSLASAHGLVFAGTWGGGVLVGRRLENRFLLLDTASTGGQLRARNVTAVMATRSPGRPWIGSFGGGPQPVDVELRSMATLPDEPADLATDGVLAIERSPDGRTFVGTMNGLWELGADGRSGAFRHHEPGSPDGLGKGYVTSLQSDEHGLWVGVGGSGLHRMDFGDERVVVHRHDPASASSLSGDFITALLEEPGGSIWVGTRSNGLSLCRIEPWSCRRFPLNGGAGEGLQLYNVSSLLRDSRGRLWMGTRDSGLHRAVRDSSGEVSEFERLGDAGGPVGLNVLSLAEDDDGTLWVATRDGLTRVDPIDLRAHRIPNAELSVESFNSGAADRDALHLYFGAVNGLLVVPAGSAFEPGAPSPVALSTIEIPGPRARSWIQMGELRELALDYGEVLQVEFAVLDFAEAPHEYRYRLGEKARWTDLGPRRSLTFASLPVGRHALEVQGRGANGLWNRAPSVAVEVVAPFWLTWWFRVAVTVGLVGAGLAFHRVRVTSIERRNRELTLIKEQRGRALDQVRLRETELEDAYRGLSLLAQGLATAKEEERRRISHELHDELGQTLTAAKINLKLLNLGTRDGVGGGRLDEAIAMVDAMIDQVRSIALRLRPPLLDEAGLVSCLEIHLDETAATTGVPIELEAAGRLTGLTPDVELVLFRVVQEAVGNSLRHAGADRITVEVDGTLDDQVVVRVSDDGCGFEVAEVRRRAGRGDHLGLLGIRERVRSVGGRLELDSSPGRGTQLRVTVPR
ncbi:MAG: ATP-binding protein [Thermoanaerobaculales bacterium]|nr:ATP-binding protein [Thermoanaerobaculales bacterium]